MAYKWTMLVTFGGYKDYKNYAVVGAVNTALGLPDYISGDRVIEELNGKPRNKIQQELAILDMPQEELHKIACKRNLPDDLEFKQSCIYDENGFAPGKYNGSPCPAMYKQLWECLSIHGASGYKKNGEDEDMALAYCNLWQRENCIVLGASEQVLDYPEVLKVIINAAEQPCKFIPKRQYLSDDNAKLHCQDREGKTPETVIINFQDLELHNKFHIITKRKE
jgi:hypothetical protein